MKSSSLGKKKLVESSVITSIFTIEVLLVVVYFSGHDAMLKRNVKLPNQIELNFIASLSRDNHFFVFRREGNLAISKEKEKENVSITSLFGNFTF